MSLKIQLLQDMKSAMKSGDKISLGVIRLINAAIKHEEIQKREHLGDSALDDEAIVLLLDKMVKQRKDSVTQYERAKREDLAQIEREEITVIERYMPARLDEAQLVSYVTSALAECNAKSMADMGRVIDFLKQRLAGKADMSQVAMLVKHNLQKK